MQLGMVFIRAQTGNWKDVKKTVKLLFETDKGISNLEHILQ